MSDTSSPSPICSAADTSDSEPAPMKRPAAIREAIRIPPKRRKGAVTSAENPLATVDAAPDRGMPATLQADRVAAWAFQVLAKEGLLSDFKARSFKIGSLCTGMGSEMIAANGDPVTCLDHSFWIQAYLKLEINKKHKSTHALFDPVQSFWWPCSSHGLSISLRILCLWASKPSHRASSSK